MTKKKKIVIIFPALLIILMTLFPPQKVTTYTIEESSVRYSSTKIEYLYLTQEPKHYSSIMGVSFTTETEVQYGRLFLQYFALLIFIGVVIFFADLNDKPKK